MTKLKRLIISPKLVKGTNHPNQEDHESQVRKMKNQAHLDTGQCLTGGTTKDPVLGRAETMTDHLQRDYYQIELTSEQQV